jgi:hypothetical protein
MGKKKNNHETDHGEDASPASGVGDGAANEPVAPPQRRGLLPSLGVGDILALLALIVLSAALLLEGYHKDFTDYSKEIIALFAVVVGFLLGRKT